MKKFLLLLITLIYCTKIYTMTTAKQSLDDLLQNTLAEKKQWTTTPPNHEQWEPMRDTFTTEPHKHGDYTIRFHVTTTHNSQHFVLEKKDSSGNVSYREASEFYTYLFNTDTPK